jgi:microcystin-dependent protein
MKAAFPQHQFGIVGPAGLEGRVLMLSENHLFDLLGPAATAEDSRNLRMNEVRDLVDAVMTSIDTSTSVLGQIQPVPRDKLAFNQLPQHWFGLIAAASQNSPYVKQYFDRHPKPESGENLAKTFAERYAALKQEQLPAGQTMDRLYEQITGMGSVSAQRQVAAQALLAYLFDACDIFEDHPSKVAS